MGKPNLVKDLCPRLLLDLCFVLRLGLGQAFQKKVGENWGKGEFQNPEFTLKFVCMPNSLRSCQLTTNEALKFDIQAFCVICLICYPWS